jgi:hypothetical protein
MHPHFEREKNLKAGLYTFIICGAVFLLFFLLQWSLPQIPPPELSEGIEVNLGNSETGSGDVQPLSPGAPSPEASNNTSTPQSSGSNAANPDKTETDNDATAPPVAPATKDNTKNNKIDPNPTKRAVVLPTPPAPKPKAVFKNAGGNGPGGNNSDSYNKSHKQGNDPSGNGDKGKPNGDPNSNSYTGTGGNGTGGPSVVRGDRRITHVNSFTGDVEPATIFADVVVSPEGVGTFSAITRGSSSNDNVYKKAITDYLKKIRFDKANHESTVNVKFIFKY